MRRSRPCSLLAAAAAGGERAGAAAGRAARRRACSRPGPSRRRPKPRRRGSSRSRPRRASEAERLQCASRPPRRRRSKRPKRGSPPPTRSCGWPRPTSPRTAAQLASEQQPVASLLAGLAMMARRPPLLALADQGGTDELVKVRMLLDSTLPVIRAPHRPLVRPARAKAERLRATALAARAELVAQPQQPASRGAQQFAALEQKALKARRRAGGRRLAPATSRSPPARTSSGCSGAEAGSRAAAAIAAELAAADACPGAARSRREGADAAAALRLSAPGRCAGHRGPRRGQRQRRSLARADARDRPRRAGHRARRRRTSASPGRSATMTGS